MRTMFSRILAAVLMLTICVTLLPALPVAEAAPTTQIRTSDFVPGPCVVEPVGLTIDQEAECGYVTVPEQHSNPDGPTIRLAVMIIRSTAPNAAPDPLFLAQGGPGGSTIDTYTQFLPTNPFPPGRDLVLFDQRGTLYAEPDLLCSEFLDLTIETIEQDLTDEEELRLSMEALQACRDRLVSEGVNLSAYNSLENAADIDALRVALGYDQINLYGVSYGTLLVLHTMRDYPEGLRSVILDAVVPPQTNFILQSSQSEDRAFTVFFEACANDPECNAAYPDLERVFFDLIDELNTNQSRIPITDPDTGITYNAVLDGDSLQGTLFQLLYVTELIPFLPKMIYDAQAGTYDVMGRILGIIVFDRTLSYGMYHSVVCAEDADFSPADVPLEGVRPEIAESAEDDAVDLLESCALWDVDPLDAFVDDTVRSDIPTLVLSGNFDPITPPAFGQTAAETLSQSYTYVFPNYGHGTAFSGGCPDEIIRAFLDNPSVAPAADCVDELTAPDFQTPADIVELPRLLPLLNLEGNAAGVLGLLGVSLLVLLSVLILWPLIWLVQLLTKRERSPVPVLGRLAPWVAALNGILLLVFLGVLFGVVLSLAFQNNNVVLFGLPGSWAWLFLLPIISVVLTLLMFASSVQSWRQGYWSVGKRVYYALLTLAAIGCVVALISQGMVGTVFV